MFLSTRSLHTSTCLTHPLTFTTTMTEQSWWFSIIYTTTTTTTNETSLYPTLPNTTAIRPIHPSIHPSISLLQTSHIPNFISTSSNDDNHNNSYSTTTTNLFNRSINQSLPSTNQIEPFSSSNNNNKKKEMKKNNQNKGKEQFSPITKNHSLPCRNPHPHPHPCPCPCLDLIVFYYGECGECGECGE